MYRLPVAKVSARDRQLVELLASDGSSHHNLQESVLDVAMTPCQEPRLERVLSSGGPSLVVCVRLQFWPSTLEMLAMFPAPKA